MEKYSQWRDAGTGIPPFLPFVPSKNESNILLRITVLLIKSIFGLLKILLVLVTALLYFLLVDVIGLILIPIKPIHRIYHLIFTCLLTRLALFFMGFYWISSETVSLKRGRGNLPKCTVPKRQIDVIVCNSTSYVELLYLAFSYDPIFTQIYSSTNTLRPVSLWKAIDLIGSYPELEPPNSGIKTFELLRLIEYNRTKNPGRPIVIFPEGATSNGRALLKFIPAFKDLTLPIKNTIRIHIVSVRYDYDNFSPAIPVGNKFWHLARLCGEFKNTLRVRFLKSNESPSSPDFKESSVQQTSSLLKQQRRNDEDNDRVGTQVINLLGQLSGLRKTSLNVEDKKQFLDYYYDRKR